MAVPMPEQCTIAAVSALAHARGKEAAFLDHHHIQAAQRVARLFERAHLRQRVTMHYGPRVSGGGYAVSGEIADMASDARRKLSVLMGKLPADCADVVLDICGYEKKLQDVEIERGWPRRSAKLVLRIGLETIAQAFGHTARAEGVANGNFRAWLAEDARPNEFG